MIFDAHLDLSMNAIDWNRDFRQSVTHIREREKGMTDKPDRGKNTVSFPAMRSGDIGLCVATLIARYVKRSNPLPGWHSPQQAWAQTQGQLAWYREMERSGDLVQITDLPALEKQLDTWPEHRHTIGYILSLEGADSIVSLEHLDLLYDAGLRALGPAHYGPGTYAYGTDASGPMGEKGRALLRKMEEKQIILDATHLSDVSFWEAMDHFDGPVWASHNLCRSLVDHNRQFSDEQIRELIRRGAVIGGALDAWMMVPGWVRGQSTPQDEGVTLDILIDHLDHICQLAGNARHIGLGTDLDGGFGTEQGPTDLDTIADLQKLPGLLSDRGYSDEDIRGILYGNWVRFLREAWQ